MDSENHELKIKFISKDTYEKHEECAGVRQQNSVDEDLKKNRRQ